MPTQARLDRPGSFRAFMWWRALLVDAIDDRAKQFYEHYGFQVSPAHPMTLMLRLANARQ